MLGLREPLKELERCAGVDEVRVVAAGRFVVDGRLLGRVDAAFPALGVRPVDGRVEAEPLSPYPRAASRETRVWPGLAPYFDATLPSL